jgi:hypothetical protein
MNAPDNQFTYGKHCIGSIICTPEFRMWFRRHQGVFLFYPFGPLLLWNENNAFMYYVYTYNEKEKR